MKPCNSPSQPAPSDYDKLLAASDELNRLTPPSAPALIIDAFNNYKVLFWQVMIGSRDVAPYQAAWGMLNFYQQDASEWQTQPDLYDKLVYVVKQTLQMIP